VEGDSNGANILIRELSRVFPAISAFGPALSLAAATNDPYRGRVNSGDGRGRR